MKKTKAAIFVAAAVFLTLVLPAGAIEIEPTNIFIPLPGGIFSFDLQTNGPDVPNAVASQITIADIIGPSGLTFNVAASEDVDAQTSYWLYGNSAGTAAIDNGDGSFTFSDGPDTAFAALNTGDIIARFAFTWDGTPGDYTFTLGLDDADSYILLNDFVSKHSMQLPSGGWFAPPITDASSSSFTIHIPEPATLLLTVGGLCGLRRRT